MLFAVAAILLAEAAFSSFLVAAQGEDALHGCLLSAGQQLESQSTDEYEVIASPEQLQKAVARGTKYIYVTEDVDMRSLPNAMSDTGCALLQATTTSVIQVSTCQSPKQLCPIAQLVIWDLYRRCLMHDLQQPPVLRLISFVGVPRCSVDNCIEDVHLQNLRPILFAWFNPLALAPQLHQPVSTEKGMSRACGLVGDCQEYLSPLCLLLPGHLLPITNQIETFNQARLYSCSCRAAGVLLVWLFMPPFYVPIIYSTASIRLLGICPRRFEPRKNRLHLKQRRENLVDCCIQRSAKRYVQVLHFTDKVPVYSCSSIQIGLIISFHW